MLLAGLPLAVDPPRYFRTVVISNQGGSEVVLLDVRALPEMKDKLRLHDDFDLAGNNRGVSEDLERAVGVSLAPGAEYLVTVVSHKRERLRFDIENVFLEGQSRTDIESAPCQDLDRRQ